MSLLATLLLEARANGFGTLDRDEWRFTRHGLLNAAREMTASPNSIVSADFMAKAKLSEGRPLKVKVYNIGDDITIGNSRSCTITGFENETELVDVTWVTLVANLHMRKAQYAINEVEYLQDLNRKLLKIDQAMAKTVDDMVAAILDAEKSGLYESSMVGAGLDYELVGDTLQVNPASQEFFFNDLMAIMQADDFYSTPYKVLGSNALLPHFLKYSNQGQANALNTQFQFAGYDFRFSNNLVPGAGVRAEGYCLQDGSLGLLSRVNIDAIQGNKTTRGTEWSTMLLETLGMEVGVQYYSECADLSEVTGLSHLEATAVEKWQLSVDVALITPHNSDPDNRAGGIKKFEFLVAEPEG